MRATVPHVSKVAAQGAASAANQCPRQPSSPGQDNVNMLFAIVVAAMDSTVPRTRYR